MSIPVDKDHPDSRESQLRVEVNASQVVLLACQLNLYIRALNRLPLRRLVRLLRLFL